MGKRSKISMSVLMKVAIGIGLSIPVAGYATRRKLQDKIRESPSYCEAMECLESHEDVKKHLGEPIVADRVDVGDDEACGEKNGIKWFTIPVSGPNGKGYLRYWIMVNDTTTKGFHVPKIELRIKDAANTSLLIREYKSSEADLTKK